jgi:transposase InsO family protein
VDDALGCGVAHCGSFLDRQKVQDYAISTSRMPHRAEYSFYYRPRPESAEELDILKRLDRIFTNDPVYGSHRLQVALLREGISIGRRRVRRLMRKLGLWAVRPKRNTSKRHPEHKVYPYILRGKTIDQPNQVWAADVTYIPMQQGNRFGVVVTGGFRLTRVDCCLASRTPV